MRLANRLLAFLLACAIGAVAVVTIIDVIAAAIGARPVVIDPAAISRWAGRNRWNSLNIELICGALAVLGLLLVVVELRRARPARLPVSPASPSTHAALTRRGVVRAVRLAVDDIDGVRARTVRVRRRLVRVSASGGADRATAAAAQQDVTAAVARRLATLELTPTPRARVSVTARSR